ncbi:MAG: hypothetical protein H6728_01695 [Myxococcales bacterium]|nr:hypothetical protein [Myxococcales bacterium]MCB9641766.1 hypothetical protein [Myxococcales bacterium]
MVRILRKAGDTEKQFTSGPVSLNYAVASSQRTCAFLIPKQTMPRQSYTQALPTLTRSFQVYALDLHGHGQPSDCPQGYSFA